MLWTLIWLVIGAGVVLGIIAVVNAIFSGTNNGAKKELNTLRKIHAIQDKALSEIAGNIAGNPVYTAQAALDESRRVRYSTDS